MKHKLEVRTALNEKDGKPYSQCERNKHKLFPNKILKKIS